MNYRILDVGDTALTIEFGEHIDRSLLAAVAAADQALARAMAGGQLPAIVETVPTFRSLTVIYDPLLCTRAEIEPVLHAVLGTSAAVPARRGRRWELPVCYGDQIATCGPDLDELAQACGLMPGEVVRLHTGVIYDVYMLGFLPGFPFMGELPQVLARPRRSEPRLRVPAGSVATAGRLTAIYPWESPGGWHLIGACPVPLFSPAWPQASLLLPGDQVGLRAVDAAEYEVLLGQMAALSAAAQPPLAFLCPGEEW
ncbi:MAG: 5-oxoprolinase subunit PxpB [Candidatus Accumulibacter sp.]|uniref:5-oxoprolinase subunit PxpB n=1 Tax=Accumulibacter sp. TaxID=2053492 RepID=UPI001A5C75C1|nr:5-oxoprolinase subunit PxpB [Accumulibacter sp.]MBL8395903.1 5-oxoprolinase subunit PxpB [Accumulibacter sp.]